MLRLLNLVCPRITLLFICALISLISTGCAFLGCSGGYPAQMAEVKVDIRAKRFKEAYKHLEGRTKGQDKVLALQERGRIASLQGNHSKSIQDFNQAAALIEEYRMGAYISLTDTTAQSASLLLNDNVIPYSGYEYEKIFIHTFQVSNYLAKGDLEGAMVEVRKTQNEQTYAEQQRSKEIAREQAAFKKYKIDLSKQSHQLLDAYKSLDAMTSRVKASFQNGYAFALSGVLYEIQGEYNDAWIAYKKVAELYPNNSYIADAVERTGRKSGMGEWGVSGNKNNTGRVVIFYEDGFVSPREQISIPIFWNRRSYTVSLPFYSGGAADGASVLSVSESENVLGRTATVCNTNRLAAKALREAYPGIIFRQILRLAAKGETQRQIQKKDSDLGDLIAVVSFFTDNADRRSWLTLPQTVQMADFELPAGKHKLLLSTGSAQGQISVKVKPGKIVIVRVIKVGDSLYASKLWSGK